MGSEMCIRDRVCSNNSRTDKGIDKKKVNLKYLKICFPKKMRLYCFLNEVLLSIALRLGGNAFHKSGAATAKAMSLVFLADLISGLARVLLPTDLRLYLDCLKDKRLVIYVGAVPCAALKVNKITTLHSQIIYEMQTKIVKYLD